MQKSRWSLLMGRTALPQNRNEFKLRSNNFKDLYVLNLFWIFLTNDTKRKLVINYVVLIFLDYFLYVQ